MLEPLKAEARSFTSHDDKTMARFSADTSLTMVVLSLVLLRKRGGCLRSFTGDEKYD
jgi:hypothetical protein